MELVVDANVLLAGFMKAAVTRELLLDNRLKLHAPEHLVYETRKHLLGSSNLRRRIGLSPKQIDETWFILTQNIESHAKTDYQKAYPAALKIAPHPEDAPGIGQEHQVPAKAVPNHWGLVLILPLL